MSLSTAWKLVEAGFNLARREPSFIPAHGMAEHGRNPIPLEQLNARADWADWVAWADENALLYWAKFIRKWKFTVVRPPHRTKPGSWRASVRDFAGKSHPLYFQRRSQAAGQWRSNNYFWSIRDIKFGRGARVTVNKANLEEYRVAHEQE